MFNLFSLKTNLNQIFLIEDEVDFYKSMGGVGEEILLKILNKSLKKLTKEKLNSLLPKKKTTTIHFCYHFLIIMLKTFTLLIVIIFGQITIFS